MKRFLYALKWSNAEPIKIGLIINVFINDMDSNSNSISNSNSNIPPLLRAAETYFNMVRTVVL